MPSKFQLATDAGHTKVKSIFNPPIPLNQKILTHPNSPDRPNTYPGILDLACYNSVQGAVLHRSPPDNVFPAGKRRFAVKLDFRFR